MGELLSLTFIGNVNKRQYRKIHLVKFVEIWQKSFERLRINFEQKSFVTQSVFISKTVCHNFVKLFSKNEAY